MGFGGVCVGKGEDLQLPQLQPLQLVGELGLRCEHADGLEAGLLLRLLDHLDKKEGRKEGRYGRKEGRKEGEGKKVKERR